MNISSVQVTITYPVVGFDTSNNNNKRRGNIGEEMLLPRTLEIKFGEEYSSVYYITIRALLFYDNAKKILQNDKYQKN